MSKLDIDWLRSPIGQQIIGQVENYPDILTASEKLRDANPEVSPEQIRQAVAQATLLRKAPSGTPSHFLLTEQGLQQSTRPNVAQYRANLIKEKFGLQNVVDLTCGLGFDAYFLLQIGHQVTPVEVDQEIAHIAKANLNLGEVHSVNAEKFELPSTTQLVFVDPARRNPNAPKSILGQSKRIQNPNDWSPNWNFIKSLALNHTVVAKVAPGMQEEDIGNWDAYWISADGDLVETMLISGGTGKRTAVLLFGNQVTEIIGGVKSKVGPIGDYLVIPNSALIRASALDFLGSELNAGLVNEHIAWLTTSDTRAETFNHPAAQILKIHEVTKFSEKELAKKLVRYQPSALTIMTRGINLNPDALRKKLFKKPTKSGPEVILAIYRDNLGPVCLICTRLK
jgi:hypothetical protein